MNQANIKNLLQKIEQIIKKIFNFFLNVKFLPEVSFFILTFFLFAYFFNTSFNYNKNILNAATSVYGYVAILGNNAFVNSTTAVTSFNSAGFSLLTGFNTNNVHYSATAWKEDASAGIEVVEYTGTGANQTISHSLGSAPEVMIIRSRSAGNFSVYHESTSRTGQLVMDTTAAFATAATAWNNASPTASNFTVGTGNSANGQKYSAFLFSEVDGFSKFSYYTGNGNVNGTFVHTGFKPKWIMVKRADSTGDWLSFDTSRDSFNVASSSLRYGDNSYGGKYTFTNGMDILSNGFKIRNIDSRLNASGGKYIYMAFAEMPYKEQFNMPGLTIASSTMFDGSTQYLQEPAATTNVTTYTVSVWVKRSALGTAQTILNNRDASNTGINLLYFNADDTLLWQGLVDGSATIAFSQSTQQVFRDPNKWYHIVANYNGTTAKLYVDGRQITDFTTNTQTGGVSSLYRAANGLHVGVNNNTLAEKFNGYLADLNVIDGLALDPTSFGQYDANCNWVGTNYSGAYGTNGIHLTFANASSPGTDTSGNGNNLTATGFDITDNTIDNPTNNFPTANSLYYNSALGTLSNGNTTVAAAAAALGYYAGGMAVPATGNWYMEYYPTALSSGSSYVGFYRHDIQDFCAWRSAIALFYCPSSTAYGVTWTQGDVIGVHLNNGSLTFYKNNVSQGVAQTGITGYVTLGGYFGDASAKTMYINAGQFKNPTSTASTLTYSTSAGGYFVYSPPAGAKAMNTSNMSAFSLGKPSNYFESARYVGTGAATSTTFLNFEPTLLFINPLTSLVTDGWFYSTSTSNSSSIINLFWMEI